VEIVPQRLGIHAHIVGPGLKGQMALEGITAKVVPVGQDEGQEDKVSRRNSLLK
jgi:hypothetical protein